MPSIHLFRYGWMQDLMNWTLESYNVIPEMHNPETRWPATKYAWFMPTIIHNGTHFALWYYIDDHARGVAVSQIY